MEVSTGIPCQGVYKDSFVVAFEGVKMYPNPVSRGEILFITTGGIDQEQITVRMYSVLGTRVFEQTVLNTVERRIGLDVGHLPKGVYVVELSTDSFSKSFNLIID